VIATKNSHFSYINQSLVKTIKNNLDSILSMGFLRLEGKYFLWPRNLIKLYLTSKLSNYYFYVNGMMQVGAKQGRSEWEGSGHGINFGGSKYKNTS
jgi:hypothetical protein